MDNNQLENNLSLIYISAAVLGVSLCAGVFQSYMSKYMKGQKFEIYRY